ncbi:hypothetical protein [Sphingomonas sp.]|uniref:hypothetical protein n=1 Tax=Sphingomonas sp. TaxID=28214 RepID=UPI0025CC8C7E|nr:hypothetical protein [Sphingomonas sp.]
MEATSQQATDHGRWDAVRTWTELRGESKLAWQYLWGIANWRPRTIQVNPLAVALDQGSNDRRTGARLLKRLAERGLIQLVQSSEDPWTVYVDDPIEVKRALLRRIAADPQGELFEERDATDARQAEPPAAVPIREVVPHLAPDVETPIQFKDGGGAQVGIQNSNAFAFPHLAPDVARKSTVRITQPEGADPPEPSRIDQAIEDARSKLQERWRVPLEKKQEDAASIVARIKQVIGEPISDRFCLRVAAEVVSGCYPWTKLHGVLESTRKYKAGGVNRLTGKGIVTGDVASYFAGAAKASMRSEGIDLSPPPMAGAKSEPPF